MDNMLAVLGYKKKIRLQEIIIAFRKKFNLLIITIIVITLIKTDTSRLLSSNNVF